MKEYLKISNEDNMELMKRFPDNYFDLAIVDPPYGAGNIKNCTQNKYKTYINEIPKPEYFTELFRVSKNQIVCGGNYFAHLLPPSRGWVCWDKKQPNPKYADGEMLWTSFDVNTKFFRYMTTNIIEGSTNISNGTKQPNIHPTQKPKGLYEWLLKNYAKENYKILDTHLGSGSIALAVDNLNKIEKMNLTLTACELDNDYYNTAIKRINEVTTWESLF